MAKITKIEQQKNKERVNLFVDGSFFCGLDVDAVVMHGLRVGVEVDDGLLGEIRLESETRTAFDKGLDYLGQRMHSKNELRTKLLRKGFSKEACEAAVAKLESYSYIDDMEFARAFVSQNGKYSKGMLQNKLRQKGVSSAVIAEVLGDVSDEREYELCLSQAQKYLRSHSLTEKNGKEKLIASLARRGYELGLIKKCIKTLAGTDDFDEYQ